MVYAIFGIVGFVIGILFHIWITLTYHKIGKLEIDVNTGLCRFRIKDTTNLHKEKYVVFVVDPLAKISSSIMK